MPFILLDYLVAEAQGRALLQNATSADEHDIARRTLDLIHRAWRTKKVGPERVDPLNLFFQAWAYAKADPLGHRGRVR